MRSYELGIGKLCKQSQFVVNTICYNFDEYQWDNGQLTLIYSEKQDAVNLLYDSDLFIRATGTLQNGSWTEQTDYFRYDADGNEIQAEIME